MPMQSDFPRLAQAIQARATALGWKQRDLIQRTHLSRGTIQSLWRGESTYAPSSATKIALEDLLGWTRNSVDAVLAGGEPTTAPTPPQSAPTESPDPAAPSTLPLSVQAALDEGQTFDTEVIEWDVAGTALHLVVVVKAGAYANEADRATLRHQMEEWARVKKGLRALISEETDGPSESHDE